MNMQFITVQFTVLYCPQSTIFLQFITVVLITVYILYLMIIKIGYCNTTSTTTMKNDKKTFMQLLLKYLLNTLIHAFWLTFFCYKRVYWGMQMKLKKI